MPTLKRILVPTDFSEFSDGAVDYACDLAGQSDATLHLVHVIGGLGRNGPTEKIRQRLNLLGKTIDENEELALTTVKEVIVGEPHRVITDYAKNHDIDLIVMGTHGRTGLAHLTLGSVAERVLRESVCPVVVLGPRRGDRKISLPRAAELIAQELGASFEASLTEGIEKTQTLLESRFHIPASTSVRLVDDLQQREWMSWSEGEPGTWSMVGESEFVEAEAFSLLDESDSQALDLVERARKLRASDVHLDPVLGEVLVRLRIDGKLEEYCRLDARVGEHLANQLKTMAHLDIAEPFLAKEGRLRLPSGLSDMEVRITIAPVAGGEAVALRLFARENIFLPLDNLGLSEIALQSVSEMLRRGEGLVLVTGPTGSGKSTTVYSMLQKLGGVEQNVVSVEDPVELAVPFVRQMNVDGKHGVTLTTGLRTILRMDPDVVFLGEIRDSEAADIAMRAANSGKYVLSTLHTRNIASTITGLRDMGIADRSMAANLTGILNQRLMRRLCDCKKSVAVTARQGELFRQANFAVPAELFAAVGCPRCRETGYRGRIGAFEVALIEDEIADAIAQGRSENGLHELLQSRGVADLRADALQKAALGITSIEEAMGVQWLA